MTLTSDNDVFGELYGTLRSAEKFLNFITGMMERNNYVFLSFGSKCNMQACMLVSKKHKSNQIKSGLFQATWPIKVTETETDREREK